MTADEEIVRIKMWQAGHDGRINALWDAQLRHNDKQDDRLGKVESRVSSLEKRVLLLSFGGAILGTAIGQQIPFGQLFGG